jgi:hypothetical protein
MLRIRIQEGQNDPQNEKKIKKFHVFESWMLSLEKLEAFPEHGSPHGVESL